MVLALEALDPTVRGILFLVALILFVAAAFWSYRGPVEHRGVDLVPLGLAFFTFVFMWDAFAAS